MSTLDILMPHYRDPEGLRLSLDSIAAQTWTGDMRVLIADDGSPDDAFAAAREVADDAPVDTVVLREAQNRGRPVTRNRLLAAAEAPYLAWLDAGDVWYPGKLVEQFGTLHRLRFEGADIDRLWVTCDYDWQWEGRRSNRVRQSVEGDQLKELLLGDRLRAYLWTLLGTAAAFRIAGRFDERLPRMQDLDYFIRFVRGGGRLVAPGGDRPLCRYNKSDVGRDATEIRRCNALIMEKNRQVYDFYGPAFRRRVLYKINHIAARFANHNGERLNHARFEAMAIAADPRYAAYRVKQHFRSA